MSQFYGDAVDEPEGDFHGAFAGESIAYFKEQKGDAVSKPHLAADFGANDNLVCPAVGKAGGADLEEVGIGFAGAEVKADFAAPAVWGAKQLQEVFFDALGGNGGEFGSESDEAGGFFVFKQEGRGEGFTAADEELTGAAFDGAEVRGGEERGGQAKRGEKGERCRGRAAAGGAKKAAQFEVGVRHRKHWFFWRQPGRLFCRVWIRIVWRRF